jgi:hypothetical protein
MLNLFKKKEVENLDTPKNLPELAKDILEPAVADSSPIQNATPNVQEPSVKSASVDYRVPNVPSVPIASGVPRLDLNLIRSSNVQLSPSELPPSELSSSEMSLREKQVIDNQSSMPSRGQFNIINLPKTISSELGDAQRNVSRDTLFRNNLSEGNASRNIYINKGAALFDDLESAIVSNNDVLAKNILHNIIPLLYEYHDVESMNDSDRLKELKDLEKFWTLLQKRNYAVKTMIDSIESDILRKSDGLFNQQDASKRVFSEQLNSAASKMSTFPSRSQPLFVPIIKSSTTSAASAASVNSAITRVVSSSAPIYVQPNERFYFKDGKIASSLKDLFYVINDISDDTFYHHVSAERNDFSNWIRDVLKENSLAKDISTIYSRKDLLDFLKDKIY